jgi:hypothetical protein
LLNSIERACQETGGAEFSDGGKRKTECFNLIGATLAKPNDTVGSLITRAIAYVYEQEQRRNKVIVTDAISGAS